MTLEVEVDGSVARVTLSRPPANAWDSDHLSELTRLLVGLEGRPQVRCLILSGAGLKVFSAGADLHQFDHADPSAARRAMDEFGEAFDRLSMFRGLTIAAINGYALGGGLEAALACDLRIAESHAVFGLPEARVGLLPGGGGTQRLPRLVGAGWAKRVILLGERIDATTAAGIGLVEQVVASGHAVDVARECARQFCLASPDASSACKRLIAQAPDMDLAEGLSQERAAFSGLFGTVDQQEGVRAFLEKRPPRWSG